MITPAQVSPITLSPWRSPVSSSAKAEPTFGKRPPSPADYRQIQKAFQDHYERRTARRYINNMSPNATTYVEIPGANVWQRLGAAWQIVRDILGLSLQSNPFRVLATQWPSPQEAKAAGKNLDRQLRSRRSAFVAFRPKKSRLVVVHTA